MIVVGLLSGTSADGIDAAAADCAFAGDTVVLRLLGAHTTPLPPAVRETLEQVLSAEGTDARAVCKLDTLLGQAFAQAAVRAIAELCGGSADLVSSHGQTVFHWVERGTCRGTLQLGQPAWIAEATGLPVVADLRARDVAAGGQGAPLAAVLDRLLLADEPGRVAALNLGGIANVSIVAGGRLESAFDTGPGNVLIDAAARMAHGAPFDRDGAGAARGRAHGALLDRLLADPYYTRAAPKSTGREHFNRAYLERHLHDLGLRRTGRAPLPGDDLLATVTEVTARTVADALDRGGVEEVVVSGGGVRNATLMDRLRARFPAGPVVPIDGRGLPAEHKEGYLFALLGFLAVSGVPGTEPAATGAASTTVLGALTPPHARFRLQAPPGAQPRRLRVAGPGT